MKNTNEKEIKRATAVNAVRGRLSAGYALDAACQACGVTRSWYDRWSARYDAAGMDGLADQPRTGRPRSVEPTPEDAKIIHTHYLRSNLNKKSGSMTLAARYCAKAGLLSAPTTEAILKPRSSKHLLPIAIKEVCRASAAETARYRNQKAGQNDGLYLPGWLRMTSDGSRRLCPNERWVPDDASVNVGVVVPWTRGGDRCSDRYGVRVARFQLLAMIDCSCDMCVGYSYVMRANDAYNASDVVSMFWRVAQLRGGMPAEMVLEGGSWQAQRTLDFLEACGVTPVSAKGRPNQKLIEGWFNKLWDVMTQTLPPCGQIGRFRGEMQREKDLWMKCRAGTENPKLHFPMLDTFLKSLDGAIDYCNTDVVGPTRDYGTWIPCEAYAAAEGMFPAMPLQPLPSGIRRFALPVRVARKLRDGGCFHVRCECPFGWPHEYVFRVEDGVFFDGADVIVAFDPNDIHAGAVVELASNWRELRAGRLLDECAVCISPAPELVRTANFWHIEVGDPRKVGTEFKRANRALVGQRVAAFDERGAVARHAEDILPQGGKAEGYGFGERVPVTVPEDGGYDNDVDFAELERKAGIA